MGIDEGGSKAEAEQWCQIAGRLLEARDLVGCKRFAERSMEADPLVEGVHQIVAAADVLLASQRRINSHLDCYSSRHPMASTRLPSGGPTVAWLSSSTPTGTATRVPPLPSSSSPKHGPSYPIPIRRGSTTMRSRSPPTSDPTIRRSPQVIRNGNNLHLHRRLRSGRCARNVSGHMSSRRSTETGRYCLKTVGKCFGQRSYRRPRR